MIKMAEKEVTKPISLDPRGGRPRDKCETYIEGIDRILNGGLPIGNIVLLAGTCLLYTYDAADE